MECALAETTVHYETYGAGRPLVILHGWPIDHRVMVSNIEPVFEDREGWQRIYPDLPGMGRTPAPNSVTSQDQVLEIVLDFIHKVTEGRRFAIAGFSYGGYLARGVVFRSATLVEGVGLIAADDVFDRSEVPLPAHTTLVKDPKLPPEATEIFDGFAVVQSRDLLDNMKNDALPARAIADNEFLSRLAENYAFSFDVDAPKEPFDRPALIVAGKQDSACGYRGGWRILENYTRGTFAVLDRSGHPLMIEQRTLFRALMSEWIDRMEETASLSDLAGSSSPQQP